MCRGGREGKKKLIEGPNQEKKWGAGGREKGKYHFLRLLHFLREVKCQRIQGGEDKINYFSLIKLFISLTSCSEKAN